MALFDEKLKSYDYYINKLPLYLQNSFGIKEQFRIWYDTFINSTDVEEEMLMLLNIFDNEEERWNYLLYIENLKANHLELYPNGTVDILDKLAALFSVGREIEVTYYDADEDKVITEFLTLDDKDLLTLIKVQIIKNHFDGSRKEIVELYSLLGLRVVYETVDEAEVDIHLILTGGWEDYDYSENIKKLFLAGKLNLESLGIKYTLGIFDLESTLIWDKEIDPVYTGWDGGKWVI